ncbi:hypothetical protein PGN61_23255, partial [Klebsiella aerogenes]
MINKTHFYFTVLLFPVFSYAGGSLQLCNKYADRYGSSVGSDSYKKYFSHISPMARIDCNTNEDTRFSLNSEGDGVGQYGYDKSKAQIKGMASGKITIKSTETEFTGHTTFKKESLFQSDIGLDNNKIINVKDGSLSETSKDAVNGSQLFKINKSKADKTALAKTDEKVGQNAGSITANRYEITQHGTDIRSLRETKADKTALDTTNKQVTDNAGKIAVNEKSISGLQDIKADKTALDTTNKQVTDNAGKIAVNEKSIS